MNGENENKAIDRVIFCSDPRQIKGFNKRKHKHEVKTKRTKKTSLKEKMQTSKPIMDDMKERARSETSSVFNKAYQPGGQPIGKIGESVKIKIGGGNTETQSLRDAVEQSELFRPRSSLQPERALKKQQQYQRYQS